MRSKSRKMRGFTFIELVISVFIMSVVAIPAILILRTGTKQSAQGMMKITTTLDARRALQRVRQDLENSIFPTRGWNLDVVNKEQLLDVVKPPPVPEYRLLCFSSLPHVGIPIDEKEVALTRRANRVTWRLEPASGTSGPFALIREEEINSDAGPVKTKITACTRVNFFAIHRESVVHDASKDGKSRFVSLYRIVLQLVDRLPGSEIIAAGREKSAIARPKGVMIADYFETVVPGFLRGKQLEPYGSQNWNGGIKGFSDNNEPPW